MATWEEQMAPEERERGGGGEGRLVDITYRQSRGREASETRNIVRAVTKIFSIDE